MVKALSTRPAGASAAFDAYCDVNVNLQTAGWCNAETFKWIYNKLIILLFD